MQAATEQQLRPWEPSTPSLYFILSFITPSILLCPPPVCLSVYVCVFGCVCRHGRGQACTFVAVHLNALSVVLCECTCGHQNEKMQGRMSVLLGGRVQGNYWEGKLDAPATVP